MDMSLVREAMLRDAIRRAILPRGTNSAHKSSPNFSQPEAGVKSKTKPKLVDVNKSKRAGFMIATEVDNHKPTILKKQAFLRARHTQTIKGQAETVEQHMSMTKPVNHRYPEPVKAHDYAEDWKRENHAQSHNPNQQYLRQLREALDREG